MRHRKPRKRVVCADGFTVSVQASASHFCEPQDNWGPYTHVELYGPSAAEKILLPYAEEPELPTETMYSRVPAVFVLLVLKSHGGVVDGVCPPLALGESHIAVMTGQMSTFSEYAKAARRTYPGVLTRDKCLSMAALGLCGEAGEVGDMIKKHLFHGHDLDREALCKELGDVLWYISALCFVCNIDMEDVARANIAKLKARYPDGFSPSASQNREGEQ